MVALGTKRDACLGDRSDGDGQRCRRRPELVYTNDHSEPECECRDCSASDVIATLTGSGLYNNVATAQEIVSLSATSPCYLSGYAELKFSSESGTTVKTTVVDGGYVGAPLGISKVSLSSTNDGSFLFQYTGTQNGATSSCPLETSLSIEIPNQSLTVNVIVNGVSLLVCGTVNVSPIIQGDSIDRYVS